MKKSFLILLGFSLFAVGCKSGEGEDGSSPDTSSFDYVLDDQSYVDLNLSRNGLNIIMQVPEQSGGERGFYAMNVSNPQYNSWHIEYGPKFEFFIIDFGLESNLLDMKKRELDDQDFFKIQYEVDTDSLLIYNRKVNYRDDDLNKESVTKSSYHIFQLKKINGYNYIFKSSDEGASKEVIIQLRNSFSTITQPVANS